MRAREKLSQFSLDDKQSAISRLVVELAGNNNNLQEALTNKVEEVVKEFSLDQEDSALSRLVRKSGGGTTDDHTGVLPRQ